MPILVMFFVLYLAQRTRKRIIFQKIIKMKKERTATIMIEVAKRFIDKECVIYAFDRQLEGTIKEVIDGAIVVEKSGNIEAINLDYVVRIREYPKTKNGKKKSVIWD